MKRIALLSPLVSFFVSSGRRSVSTLAIALFLIFYGWRQRELAARVPRLWTCLWRGRRQRHDLLEMRAYRELSLQLARRREEVIDRLRHVCQLDPFVPYTVLAHAHKAYPAVEGVADDGRVAHTFHKIEDLMQRKGKRRDGEQDKSVRRRCEARTLVPPLSRSSTADASN